MSLVFAFLFAFPSFATLLPAASVPAVDPYVATLSVRLLKAESKVRSYDLPALPGRSAVPIFGNKPALQFAFFAAKPTAPLVFVVPGVGGSSNDGSALYVGDVLNHAGYNVAVVANPFSWQFVLKRSPEAVPGFIPVEARELATMFSDVRKRLSAEGVHPSKVMAVGYSLGAIHLGFLQMAEHDLHAGLSRVVLINPPLDMGFALGQLDKLEQFRDHFTFDQQQAMWGNVISKAGSLKPPAKGVALADFMQSTMKAMNVSRGQAAFLIGETFRQSLSDIMLVSQQVHDRGLLKQPISKWHMNAREAEANNILYGTYMHSFMMPFWQRSQATNFDDAGFVAQGSLVKHVDELAALPEIRLIHNTDDFLTNPGDLAVVDKALGARAMIFPYGGHVGNLWAPNVQRAIVGALQ